MLRSKLLTALRAAFHHFFCVLAAVEADGLFVDPRFELSDTGGFRVIEARGDVIEQAQYLALFVGR